MLQANADKLVTWSFNWDWNGHQLYFFQLSKERSNQYQCSATRRVLFLIARGVLRARGVPVLATELVPRDHLRVKTRMTGGPPGGLKLRPIILRVPIESMANSEFDAHVDQLRALLPRGSWLRLYTGSLVDEQLARDPDRLRALEYLAKVIDDLKRVDTKYHKWQTQLEKE